jgi:hypothetical protein
LTLLYSKLMLQKLSTCLQLKKKQNIVANYINSQVIVAKLEWIITGSQGSLKQLIDPNQKEALEYVN